MKNSLCPWDVLCDIERADATRERPERQTDLGQDSAGFGKKLSGGASVAERMRSLAKEPDAVSPHVQPSPHAIPANRRRLHRNVTGLCHFTDPRERVLDDFRLERQLALVGDVGIIAPATRRVALDGPAVGVRLQHVDN